MRLFINAGHDLMSPGAVSGKYVENKLTMELRDVIVPLLAGVASVIEVPDELDLKQSIEWINKRATVNDVAISVHFNSFSDSGVGGTEAFYSNEREKQMAEIFSRTVSTVLGLKNRGAKHDSKTWIGSLGWLRRLVCDSVVVEICFLTHDFDMNSYSAPQAAQGIKDGIVELLPRKEKNAADKIGRDPDLIYTKESFWNVVVAAFLKCIRALKK